MKKISIILCVFALAALFAACVGNDGDNGGANAPDDTSGGNVGSAPQHPDESPADQPESPNDAKPNDPPESGMMEPAPADGPPAETIDIELEIEGMSETRTGTLAESDNGYYMYTLPLFVFTPEEPSMDQIFMETYPDYFMRIQTLGQDVDIDEVKRVAADELQELGEVVEMRGDQIYNAFIREHAAFHLHAVKPREVTKYIMLVNVDGHYFRIMLHMPHGEASEGAGPSFEAMIGTITPVESES